MTGGVMLFHGCKPLPEARTSLLCFQVIDFRAADFLKFCHVLYSYATQASFEKFYYPFAEKRDKLFWTRQNEKIPAFLGKDWNAWKEKIFCVSIVQKI